MLPSEIYKKNKWVIVENFFDKKLSSLLYQYIKNEAVRLDTLQQIHGVDKIGVTSISDEYGTFDDGQVTNAFSKYGDLLFDTITEHYTKKVEMATGLNLKPQYSYHRLYVEGNELKKHKDRKSCSISATIFLGSDGDTKWPMYLKKDGEEETHEVNLKEGDALFYDGYELLHWREEFKGKNHAQLFIHYTDESDKSVNFENDKRPCLGLHAKYKLEKYKLVY